MNKPQVMLLGIEDDPELQRLWAFLNKHKITPIIYDDLVSARWHEELNFCGCGDPEGVKSYIKRILDVLSKRQHPTWVSMEEVQAVVASDLEMAFYFVMYVLDAMKLTEHGGSVGGAWLSEKGHQLRDELGKIESG